MAFNITSTTISTLANNHASMTVNGFAAASGGVINSGDNLVVTADSGYKFTANSVYFEGQNGSTGEMIYLYFTFAPGGKTGAVTFDSGSYWALNVATIVAVPDYVVISSDIAELALSGSTLKINGVEAVEGSGIFVGDSLVIEAGLGYEFYPQFIAPNVESSVYFTGQNPNSGSVLYLVFELSEDNLTASTTFSLSGGYSYYSLKVGAVQSTTVSGTNNVYQIDSNKLAEINNVRFSGTPPDVYDYGQFILSVIELPFSISEDIILEPEKIMLATFETDIEAPKISTDKIIVDLGSITTPSPNNLLDFKNTTVILHLPRTESIAIEADYVIGETISIKYIIDCYTGMATINISSTKIGGVIHTLQADLGVNIPYAVVAGSAQLSNSNIKVGGDNGVRTPYIEVIKNNAVLPYGFFTIPILDESVLLGYEGFTTIEEIKLISKANSYEKDLILSQLNSGVIIKWLMIMRD